MKNEISFAENLIKIIEDSRNNALKRVNEELIQMYWKIGESLSKEAENTSFGDAYIDSVAKEIGYIYIDSGAMYRAVTLYCLENGLFNADGSTS